jgi:hypothetical protein
MTVNKTEEQLPGAFAPSAIQQIGSLGTLVGAVGKGSFGKDIADIFKGLKLPSTDMYGNASGSSGSSGYIDANGQFVFPPTP